MQEKRGGTVQSVERAIQILRCFYQTPELGITEISRLTELHKSTVFGIVNTLSACDMLMKDEQTGRYRLGLEAYRLGVHCDMDIRAIAIPFMHRLMKQYGETVNLVRRGQNEIIYIEKLDSPQSMYIATRDGARVPYYCSGVGRAILAFLPPEEMECSLKTMRYEPFTAHAQMNEETLRVLLPRIRACGYSVDEEEFAAGVCCIGVPILNADGFAVAGLSISGPVERMRTHGFPKLAASLQASASEISHLQYPSSAKGEAV